jgi:tetratricopeptide (TPR) repeat protein
MAKALLDGLTEGEDRGAQERPATAPARAEAFAAAIVADQAKQNPDIAQATAEFLHAQRALLNKQVQRLDDERPWHLRTLRNQSREGRMRRLGTRINLCLQVLSAIAFAGLALGIATIVAGAIRSHAVVVDAFATPPALAATGVDGQMVASAVLDALQKLQSATRSVGGALNAQNAWSNDIQIDLPQTGISIGEVVRLLHQHLGRDVHIGGGLVQTAAGLSLTLRGDGIPAATFTGGPADLDALTVKAAEYAYGRSQPLNYAIYLEDVGRGRDAIAFLAGAIPRSPSNSDRALLENSWGNALTTLGRYPEAAEKYRDAMALHPPNWTAWANLVGVEQVTLGEEAGWRQSRLMLDAAARAKPADRPELFRLTNPNLQVWDLPAYLAGVIADAARNGGAGTTTTPDGPPIADAYALMHDPRNAAIAMAASDPDDDTTKAEAALLQTYAALDANDPPTAVRAMQSFRALWNADPNLQYTYSDGLCFLGLADGMAGRLADAEAAFRAAGQWSRCAAFHGAELEHNGDLAGAERVWAAGIEAAPDLPHIHLYRGLSELNRGDFAHAQADFAAAHANAPHFADPLKAWGDVLMRAGNHAAALAKYTEAETYAPAWPALQSARAEAAKP